MRKSHFRNRVKLPYCDDKPSYDKKTAVTAKNKRWKDNRVKLRIYQCKKCDYWHLTSTEYYEK